MKIIRDSFTLSGILNEIRMQHKSIGFVPTMGALHEGHLSLLNTARAESDFTVVSIFVNPTQFNDKKDLENYPRNEEKDLLMLSEYQCDCVYIPKTEDIYPETLPSIKYDLGGLDQVMEGFYRPGHFNGVAMVVHRLFDMVHPDKAFFGEKDFQQLAVIKYITKNLSLNIQIIPCKTIRENDGLAMSSRNLLLKPEQRLAAPLIYKTLQQSKNLIATKGINFTKDWVINEINKSPYLNVEYYEIVDSENLKPAENYKPGNDYTGCIAVFAGNVRLIDNMKYNS